MTKILDRLPNVEEGTSLRFAQACRGSVIKMRET
jgi:hypothetical protein